MTSREMLNVIKKVIEDKKGENIKVIDISEVSLIADFFIVASAVNFNQLSAITDAIEEELTKFNIEPSQIEGAKNSDWILLDYKDVVVHLFEKDARAFYNIERIWQDGKYIEI